MLYRLSLEECVEFSLEEDMGSGIIPGRKSGLKNEAAHVMFQQPMNNAI